MARTPPWWVISFHFIETNSGAQWIVGPSSLRSVILRVFWEWRMGTWGSNLGLPPNQLCPWRVTWPLPVWNGPSWPAFPLQNWAPQRLCNGQAQDFSALTQKSLEITFALSAYWSHVLPYVGCVGIALILQWSLISCHPQMLRQVAALGLVLVTKLMGVRGQGWSPGRFRSRAGFHKEHPVASLYLLAEIHFQPRCSNCAFIWNYLCWLLSSGLWKWGILHLVVNDFILYFPGERECAYKRSPLLVFQHLLRSCERFYLKKGIWVYCIKTLAFLHLQSNCGLNSL